MARNRGMRMPVGGCGQRPKCEAVGAQSGTNKLFRSPRPQQGGGASVYSGVYGSLLLCVVDPPPPAHAVPTSWPTSNVHASRVFSSAPRRRRHEQSTAVLPGGCSSPRLDSRHLGSLPRPTAAAWADRCPARGRASECAQRLYGFLVSLTMCVPNCVRTMPISLSSVFGSKQ